MEESKALFCSSKFSWARESKFLEFIDNLGLRTQKDLPSLN
jgi:hypothetical protein